MQTTALIDGDALATEDLSNEVLASEVLADMVGRDGHVLLPAGAPHAVLDRVAVRLAAQRRRVLRPSTIDALTLPGLLAQIVDAPGEIAGAADLERGFELLTDPGSCCDRIVLLIDRADALDPAALRYLQLLIRDAPLRLLLVGGPGFYDLLVQDEFAGLRRAFVSYAEESTVADAGSAAPVAERPVPGRLAATPPSPPRSRRRSWLGRRLLTGSMAACAFGIVWLVHSSIPPGYLVGTGLLAAVFPAASHL